MSHPNETIPSGEEVRKKLSESAIANSQSYLDKDVTYEEAEPAEFFRIIEKTNLPHVNDFLSWVKQLLDERREVKPVFLPSTDTTPRLGVSIPAYEVDELEVIIELDYLHPSEHQKSNNDALKDIAFYKEVPHLQQKRFSVPQFTFDAKDIFYRFATGKGFSLQSLQPVHTKIEVVLATSTEDRQHLKDEQYADESGTLHISENNDREAVIGVAHETGHKWARYLKLDALTEEQYEARRGMAFGHPISATTDGLKPFREIQMSERLASLIARMIVNKIYPEDKSSMRDTMEAALQTYDSTILDSPGADQIGQEELKEILSSRVNRTKEGWQQLREVFKFHHNLTARISGILSKIGPPKPGGLKVWELSNKNTQSHIQIVQYDNVGESFKITFSDNDGRTLKFVTMGKSLSVESDGQLIVNLSPGLYVKDLSESKEKISTVFDKLMDEINQAIDS